MSTHTVGDFTYTLNGDLTAIPSAFVGSGNSGTFVSTFSANGQTYSVKLEGSQGYKNITNRPVNIVIPPGITNIGYRYFYNANGYLTTVSFSHDMTIGANVCQWTHSLEYFPFEHIIGTIGYAAFEGCYFLDTTHINIAKATSIEKYAFYRVGNWVDTTDKATITLGDSVTSIHIDAFYEVDRLAKVTFGVNVPDINAFKHSTIISMVFNGTTVPAGTNVAHYANVEVYAANIADTSPFHAYGFVPANIYITDTAKPIITLTGGEIYYIAKDSSFTEPGYEAYDGFEGTLTSSVVVNGTVDTSTIGTYTITYDVSDSAGNTAQKTRTIIVLSSYPYVAGDFTYRLRSDLTAIPSAFVGSGNSGTFVSTINVTEMGQIYSVKLEGSQGYKYITNRPVNIVIPPGITNIGYRYFYNANGYLTTVSFSHDMTIDDSICQSTHSLLHFPFEHIIGTIGKYAFEGCTALDTTNINIAKASYIDKSAFLNVGRYSNITEKGTIIFGDSVTYIDSSAFGWDEKIHHATFGANVPDINAFKLNTTIETMTFTGTTVPAGTYVANYANITVFAPNIADTTPFHAYGFLPANINSDIPEDIVKVIQTMKIDGKSVSELSTSEKSDIVANTTATYIPITRTMLQDNGIDDTQYNDAQITEMIRIALSDGSIVINIVVEFPPDLTGSISTATVNNTLTNMLTTVQNNMLDLVKTATGDVTLTLNPVSGTIDVAQAQTDVNATNVPDLPAQSGNNFVFSSISKSSVDGGASNADKRTFTKNSISSLLTKYQNHISAGKTLKLQAGVSIPGFDSIPATDDVFLFDARVTKTFTRSQLMKKRTYMVLNDNEPVTFYTVNNKTVTVTQSGSVFIITKTDGTMIERLAGSTIVDDGLNMTFGSVSTYLDGFPAVDMVLDVFDSAFTLSSQATLPDLSYQITASAEILLTQQISASDLSAVFYFKTDEDITSLPSDSSNVMYYLDRSKWTGGQATLNPMNGIVTSGYYGSNTTDNLAKDFLRDMAQHLFNTHFGVDLFTNEDAVVSNISTNAASKATNIYNMMGAVDITNTGLEGPDASNNYYKKDDTSNTNLTREILNQLLTAAPGRFDDKVALRLNSDVSGCYGMPFIAGDTLSYKLFVTANSNQHLTVNTGNTQLGTRTYKVVFKAS